MLLTLEIISANGDALGSNRRKTVGPEGARIGRARDSDWVINDQYISRTHAQIRYVGGTFYIEGLGRNPLALNDPGQTIPNNEPQLLRDGDRFFLDEYEIKVTMATAGAVAQTLQSQQIVGDPFAAEGAARTPAAGSQSWDMGIVDAAVDESASLDPLAALGGSPARKEAPLPPVNIHQGSVLDDNYQLPVPTAQPAPGDYKGDNKSANKIPDAWDRSGFTQMGQQPQAAALPKKPPPPVKPAGSAQAPKPGDSSIPDTWDKSRLTQLGQAAATANPPLKSQPAGIAPTSVMPPKVPPVQETAPNVRPQQPAHTLRRPVDSVAAPPPVERPSDRAVEQKKAPPATAAAGGSLDLEELLRAAGLTSTQMSPELASELGQVLRIVVQGVMEVLQSRAEIKSQLRMSMTRMQATENNPLKFSPNVEAALHTLLVERNRGYLPTTRAFQEALTDIRNHQIAVLQGIREAFDSMLEHFDPERLEEEFERGTKRGGLLNLGAKSRFRDNYVEQFASMTKDPDESFRRLFGEYFAQAYEAQMDRLKASGRTAGGQ
jgi:type VI secretion system FHA domain protein